MCANPHHILCLDYENRPENNSIENWSCQQCNINIFPYNSIENEIEFRCVISNNNIDNDFLENNDFLLNYFPSELNDVNNDILTEDFDPEVNYYNEFTYSLIGNSKYHNSDSFNLALKNDMSKFSLISSNIRSASKNLDEFLCYLQTLNHTFSFHSQKWMAFLVTAI